MGQRFGISSTFQRSVSSSSSGTISTGEPAGTGASSSDFIHAGTSSFDTTRTGSSSSGTVHTNPDWLDKMRQNFFQLIVEKCSEDAREAVLNNANITVSTEEVIKTPIVQLSVF